MIQYIKPLLLMILQQLMLRLKLKKMKNMITQKAETNSEEDKDLMTTGNLNLMHFGRLKNIMIHDGR